VISEAFNRTLTATGYITADGRAAPGLVQIASAAAARLRPVLADDRIGLNAEAVFSAQNTPAVIFKDAGVKPPTEDQIQHWHEAAWNVGVAPLLWVVTPTDVRLYNCYASPSVGTSAPLVAAPLDRFELKAPERLRTLDAMCGRLATETGAFWSSPVGAKIDRRHRVDRELLNEINALEEKLTLVPSAARTSHINGTEIKASRDFAQRLIGRCIFTSYLIDRGIAQRFLPADLPPDLATILSTPKSTFDLFDWLRATFNGDLFPMDDPGAERQRLSVNHLGLLRDFAQGRSLVPGTEGQGRLFRFRFDAIPVDLISSIYQQFARSSAEEDAHLQGLHYTPIELVHLTLDPVFEGLSPSARILDATCGSGAFLVEAFRRLVWKTTGGQPARRSLVRDILYNRLFGIDINRSALGIAAFSLYLAALEFDDEPVTDIADLKFDRLIGTTLFEADTLDELPPKITKRPFDAVVGNPPWTFDSRRNSSRRKRRDGNLRPRRSPDQAFLQVAARLAGATGRIGMVMKASPFFSKEEHAVNARNALLRNLSPAAVVNLSALRKEKLFPDATGPALLFLARCVLMEGVGQLLVGSVPWTADFRRNGVFHVGPGEVRPVSLARVLRTPAVLKATTFGTVRDGWLIEKLEQDFPTLDAVLTKAGLAPLKSRGQGFQVEGDRNIPPEHYYDLKVLTPDDYQPFRLDMRTLPQFSARTLHRPRETAIFRGPLLICPKASFKAAVEPGRYSAVVNNHDLLFSESFYGVSFAGHDPRWANVISAILNSSLTSFQLAFGGGAWGLERSTVEPNDLLSIRVPDFAALDPRKFTPLIEAEATAAAAPNPSHLGRLDQAVFDLYELDPDETVLARESVVRARMFIFEGREQRRSFIKPPHSDTLAAYAKSVVRVVDRYLAARDQRHLEATIYTRPVLHSNWARSALGLTAVRFTMAAGGPGRTPVVHRTEASHLQQVAELLQDRLQTALPPYLNSAVNSACTWPMIFSSSNQARPATDPLNRLKRRRRYPC
jgi:hypothetical protein